MSAIRPLHIRPLRSVLATMKYVLLGVAVYAAGISSALAACPDPELYRELSQLSIHSGDARLHQHLRLLVECGRDERERHMASAQQTIEEFQSRADAHAHHDHDRVHHHDQATASASTATSTPRFVAIDGVFPPQPAFMEQVEWPQVDEQQALASQSSAASPDGADLAQSSAEVAAALGSRYVYFGGESLAVKGDRENNKTRLTWFSYTNNATIEVTVAPGTVVSIHAIPPELYQPPLLEEEVADAVRIARASLLASGGDRFAALNGHAILALPATADSAFFPHRMAYVSFHANADAGPEYVLWVDLTNQVVVNGRED